MIKRTISCGLFILAFSFGSYAQRMLSLEDCVQIAEENALTLKQARLIIENAEINLKEAQMSRLPSLNGSASAGLQYGRTIDPTTNDFGTSEIGFNSLGLNSSVLVYGGGRINHNIARSKYDLKAAMFDGENALNNLGLTLANVYLQILLTEDQLENAKRQLRVSQDQYEQSRKFADAGVIPENDLLDLEAQVALNEQAVLVAEGNKEVAYLTLVQLLELDAEEEIKVSRPELNIPVEDPMKVSLNQVYQTALGNQPSVKAADFRLKSAEESISIAQSAALPQLVLFGSLSSNWSSLGREVVGFQTQYVPLDLVDPITGESLTLQIGQDVPMFSDQLYLDQLNQNFGQSVGLSLNIPIFNGLSTRSGVKRARLNAKNIKLTNNQQLQQLKTDIQRAIIQARTSKLSYYAAEKAFNASDIAFENSEKKFALGALNTLELNTARNLRDRAETDLLNAKYQYIFNMKVLDFYMGRGLTLN